MPTLCLSAHPAHLIRRGTQDMPIMDGCGRETAREETHVTVLAEVTAAIAAFGARVRGGAPGTSFLVSVKLQTGGHKPRGFDAACLDGSLGHLNFLRRRDATVAVPFAPSVPAAQGRTA